MSKVKITGNPSGSAVYTLTTGTGSTDRTITLPDASGTLAFTTDDDDKMPLAGGAFSGAVTTNSTIDGRDVAADGVLATNALPKSGGTITGDLAVNGGSVFNEASADVDFRIESNAYTHAFMLQGSDGFVGLGINVPLNLLHLRGGSDNSSTGAPIIRMQKQSGGAVADGHTIGGMSFWVNDDGVDSGASKERAKIVAESQNTSSATRLEFWTGFNNAAIAERMRIAGDGKVLIGGTTNTYAAKTLVTSDDIAFAVTDGTKTLASWAQHGGQSNNSSAIGTRSNHDFSLITNDTKRVVIGAAGVVAIKAGLQIATGTVVNTGNSGGNLTIVGGATYPGGKIKFLGGQAGGSVSIHAGGAVSSPPERMRVHSSGAVSIGSIAPDEAQLLVQSPTEYATGTDYNTFGNLHVSTDTQGTNKGGTISMGGLGRQGGPTEYFKYAQLAGRAEAGDGSPRGYLTFETTSGVTNLSTERMRITSDGRGLSQFTAKAWINFNGTSTVAIRDSHNVSSVTDTAQGNYRINYANALANTSYCPTIGNTADTLGNGDNRWILVVTSISTGYLDVVSTIVANGFNKQDKTHCLVTVFGD